ncbi:serine/threonine protein kinase [Blastopirellula sp. JC732]|uniref:non-specific serine/threonine protein kinase n=1 Tax=Blastopirellula sediminis TaxID=2894196 RepID=A0A9X1MNN0_9BACT|nr:serine/threonine-protein kinase [Blastopirellula sediminis]MCC9607110.1 serine/threonine protein kinase [Blastopirellula sediminis]MCC9629597.1 serine/threonine protein kinase [Blastopirellula sediminis]
MTPEDYQLVCDAFEEASQLPPAERSAWLAARFAERSDLRKQVAAMLDQADDSRLDRSPLEAAMTPDSPTIALDASDSNALLPPRHIHIDGYQVEEEIARGGMGVVYRARQQNPNRTVALKMILTGQFASRDEVARFRIEAEAAANLNHPGIVPIYEVGSHSGRHYFSMGYVPGKSLAVALKTETFTPEQAADLVRQIAEAIEYAHQHGVIHRDLKPSNVLLDENGRPLVTDFGLAKRVDDESNLTCTGQVMGSPGYMSPEQASGRVHQIGAATDVYGLGAILYALLTGKPPFENANFLEAINQICFSDVTPPRKSNWQIPRKLETICLKCLHKTPNARYRRAADLAADLRAFLNNEPIQARPLSPFERLVYWARRRPGLAINWAAVVLFYSYHLFCVWVLHDPVSSQPTFQAISIGTAVVYAVGAWFFQRMYERPRTRTTAIFAWMTMNVALLTLLLFSTKGVSSPLVLGYLLLVAASGALYQKGLVGYVTTISLVCYYLHVLFAIFYPGDRPLDIHWTICLTLSILLLGMIQYFVVRKIRMANA